MFTFYDNVLPVPYKSNDPLFAVITFRMLRYVKKQIVAMARKENRTLSQMVRILINEAIAARTGEYE